MEKKKSVGFNFIMNTILSISSFIFPLITFPYISRTLQPEGVGAISFATSVIAYFSMFAQLGIPVYGIRTCARVRDDYQKLSKVVHEILAINLFTCLIAYCFVLIAIFNVPIFYRERELFLITSLTLLFNTLGMGWLYQSLEKYTYITVRSIIFKVISILAMFLMVHSKEDYIIYGGISVFASGGSSLLNFINARKYISINIFPSYNIRQHLKPILIFLGMSIATTIYTNLDNVMLGFLKTEMEVGYYSAAVKIKSILISLVTGLGAVLLPRVSYYYQNGMKKEFYHLLGKAVNFVTLLSIPLTIYFIIYAKEGILFLSGNSFYNSVIPMKIIMPTIILIGLSNIMGFQVLIPMGKEKVVLFSEVCGGIINIIINIALIPRYGAIGAAIGTLVAEGIVSLVQYCKLGEIRGIIFKDIKFIQLIVACISAVLISSICKYINISNLGTLLLSACLFFGTYIIVLLITKEPFTYELISKLKFHHKTNKD